MQNIKEKINKVLNLKKNLEQELVVSIKGKKKYKTGVYLGKNIKIEPNVFFDVSDGKILIDDNTKIKAGSILRGPLVIGKNCVINSQAEISCSKIGDVCKIGGEVTNCVIENYTNKAHYGFLGHSYVGSWVNIGGGTSISNMKNTYTNIKVGEIDTASQFFGCILGDGVKTSINTSVFCGKIIGESAHLYGTVTEDVPAFTSHISPGNFYELPLDLAIKIQKAMMKRRNMEFTEKDQKNFEKLFKDTEADRKKIKVKKGKLLFK